MGCSEKLNRGVGRSPPGRSCKEDTCCWWTTLNGQSIASAKHLDLLSMEKLEQRDGSSMDSRCNVQDSLHLQKRLCRSVPVRGMRLVWRQEPDYFFSTIPGLPSRSALFLKSQMPSVNFAD